MIARKIHTPDGAEQQKLLASELVDGGHGDQREEQVGAADQDGLHAGRIFAGAGRGEDVVQVVQAGVDAGELVERARRDGHERSGNAYFRWNRRSLPAERSM